MFLMEHSYFIPLKVIIWGMKMNEKKLIGQRIKELRKNRGLSQEKLAEKAETSPNYLSRMERGTENPTLDMLIKLSNALEVEMWEMFDFGHVKSHKELKESIRSIIKSADESSLRLALKVIRAVVR
jgi:transcriptional regulator with XRE-family HTH domain